MFSDIFGTMRNSFRIGGLAGVRLVNQGGNLQIRDGGDTAYQNLHCNSLNLETPLPVAEGGTGATTAADARTNLGAAANAYSSSVSGFTPTTVAAALDELAAYRKLSPGISSNSNGLYVRWEDGLQICWNSSAILTYETDALLSYSWTYPASFSATPVVSPTFRSLTSSAVSVVELSICYAATAGNTLSLIRLAVDTTGADRFTSGDTGIVQIAAVGRWK